MRELKKAVFIFKPHIDSLDEIGKIVSVECCDKQNTKPKVRKCYQMFDFTVRCFQKIDENKTIYQEVNTCNMGGWVYGYTMTKIISKDRAFLLKNSILEGSKVFRGKKISDFKEQFTPIVDGIPKDAYGRMVWDLQIEKRDKEFEERKQSKEEILIE
jgi:hypothetical protein